MIFNDILKNNNTFCIGLMFMYTNRLLLLLGVDVILKHYDWLIKYKYIV